jgi:hypothetical protein
MALKAEHWTPSFPSDSGAIRTLEFDVRNQIADPDNPGGFKLIGFDAPAKSIVTLLGYSVIETTDDSNGQFLLSHAAGASPWGSLNIDSLTPTAWTIRSQFYNVKTRLDINQLYGDGTTGKFTIYFQVLNG